jgi:hypothetical protein
MKFKLSILTLFIPILLFPQSQINGVILDKDTHEPLEFVDVSDDNHNTSSNEDGYFRFSTNDSSINFNLLGYEIKNITLETEIDTIYLKNKFIELEQVFIGNSDELVTSMFKKILDNYPLEPYSESFFMRSFLKKDGKIIKLQDLNGYIGRKTLFSTSKSPMPRKNYTVNISNMRKAGFKDDKKVYFEMFSFEEFFQAITSLYISPDLFNFEVESPKESEFLLYNFTPKERSNVLSRGHFLVNSKDNSFREYYMINEDNSNNFKEKRNIKYRTYFYELNVKFKKSDKDSKYYLSLAKLNAKVEVQDKTEGKNYYQVEYLWLAGNPGDFEVDANTSLKKDIFKIDKKYDPIFWQNQSQLPLTLEMEAFLNNLRTDADNQYEVISNFKG